MYEERQADPAVGAGDDAPVPADDPGGRFRPGQQTQRGVSGAGKSGLHLQFAYFESSLVVEYLVETHGLAKPSVKGKCSPTWR